MRSVWVVQLRRRYVYKTCLGKSLVKNGLFSLVISDSNKGKKVVCSYHIHYDTIILFILLLISNTV